MDDSVRDALLNDPKVKEAVKNAGMDAAGALSNPEVQTMIIATCREKFPEFAGAAQAKVIMWANDPDVQKQAYEYAGVAGQYAWHAVDKVAVLIEQGPTGVRVLAFIGGVATCVNALLVISGLLNPVSVFMKLVTYVFHAYLVIFALTTMLFEAKPEWIQKFSGLDSYQNMLIDKASFLTDTLGRGLFYGFQGTVWLSFASLFALQNLILGLYLLAIAVLHISMHFGVMPMELKAKMQNIGAPAWEGNQRIPEGNDAEMPLVSGPASGGSAGARELAPAGEDGKKGCCTVQ